MPAEVNRLQKQHRDPEQALFEVSRGFVRFCLAHPQHFPVVFFGPENQNGVRVEEYIETIGQPFFERLLQIFINCSEAVGLSAESRLLDARTWWVSLFGTTEVLIQSGPAKSLPAHHEIVERHIQIMWRGFRAVSVDSAGPNRTHKPVRGSGRKA